MLSKFKRTEKETHISNNQVIRYQNQITPQQRQVTRQNQPSNFTTPRSLNVSDRYKSESFEIKTCDIQVTSREIEEYGYPMYSKNVVVLEWTEWKPLLVGFSDFYKTNECMNFAKQDRFGVTIGKILTNGSVLDIFPEIRQRLLDLSLLNMLPGNNEISLYLPLLMEEDFEIIDDFRWFAHDNEIKTKLQYIHKICELMIINTQLSYEKFQKFGDSPKVHLVNINKGTLQKVKSIHESEKPTSTITVIQGNTNYDLHNTKDRLRMKHSALTSFVDQKETLLKKLQHNVDLFTSFSSYIKKLYPNKVQAYLICEIMLNKALLVQQVYSKHKENPFFKKAFKEILHTTHVLVQFVELLLPYAIEITKECGINLENNKDLQGMRDLKELILRNMHEEYQEYDQYKAEYGNDSYETEENDSSMSSEEETVLEKLEESSIIQMSLEEKKMLELTKAENEAILKARKLQREEAAKMSKLAREEKKIQKEQAEIHIKSQKAKSLVSLHKTVEEEKEQKELKERLNSQIKIHDLPTNEFVQKMIASLKGGKLDHFEMLFSIIDNDCTMNDKDVLNLAKHIKNILFNNDIGCGIDLLNEVKARIHKCHESDTGDLLPRNYVQILRTCFVIFGIFPKDWKPQTEKDFKALIKYNNRLIAKMASEAKIW